MDFAQLSEIIGLASNAVGVTSKAVTTATDIKNLFSGKKPPDVAEASKLLNSLATDLTAANMTNVQLSTALKALSEELRRQDEFQTEKSRYQLFQTDQNDMVYALKEDAANGQPLHFICPVCLSKNKLFSFITGEGDYKFCQADSNHQYRFKNTPWQQPRRQHGDWMA